MGGARHPFIDVEGSDVKILEPLLSSLFGLEDIRRFSLGGVSE
jgi:hypothetical protein